ncbi:TonB-dependent siderophore receptor [Aliarcobacter butzleri]|uniref:TonB-dependent siderophore receptor n=1 Tax=Aliarcobacter butzleri TaxID=28197 RepID=UPI00125EA2C3|nr:TonB-dependent siderophore receptor [Aliarcobacter butzleri]MCT7550670.1 TonB-dependent siderophore receptor [Aliarcobacter butzleri]MCT7559269.1 TonB-dependent siderophore receptor [Aliarcobacter butzleri]MCT7626428.1 TonB-dependent siderophore receptor [Aliarcobacter butzleri]MCT7637841.1 TonB-dependent siderophore receptor [Aliarcobacter butzleri]MCT7643822.1 TonB-dependent siderophore receptor [Aliarcobacter butzleri]
MNKKGKIISMSFFVSMVLGSQLFAAQNSQNTTVLEEIKVSENNLILNSVTEETGSYTTGATSTATKLDLSLRETPQSVLVFTRQKLDDQNITSFQELLAKTPGVSVNKWDERVAPTARGFSVDYYLFDGMPTYQQSANDIDLIVFDRVEVVKGANGLTTGAGNPAMGMNFIRKHANSKEFKGNIDLNAGSWDSYSQIADIQTPLNSDGSVRARFVAKHEDKKSYMDNYEKQTDVFYGVVDMDLTDTTFASFGASYEDLQRDGVRWGGLPAFYTDGSRTNFSRSKTVSGDWTYWDVKTKTYFADLKQYVYDDISLNLSLSQRNFDTDTKLAYFSGKIDKNTGLGTGSPSRYTSEKSEKENNIDLYASVPFEIANLEQEIVVGTMYNKHKVSTDNWKNANLTNVIIDVFNIQNPYSNWTSSGKNTLNSTTQKAVYLAGKFSLMEDLKLISGVRVSSWEYNAANGVGNREFDNEVTPYVGLIYDLDDNHSIYTSYTSIFKPQNFKDTSGNYLDPIDGKSYETGIKGEYFDGRLNTAISIFRIEQDGVGEKIDGVFVANTTEQAYKVAKGVVSKGVELNISGEIADNFNLDFGLANFEAEQENGTKFNTDSSRTTANLFAKYTIDDYRFGAGLNYKSKFYTGSNATKITQDAFITTDLMAGYKVNKNLDFQLNINNVFDEKYYDRIGNNSMVYGDPRNFTLGMKYTF